MDKGKATHVAIEAVAFVGLVTYFVKQISELRAEIEQLKEDVRVTAQHQNIIDSSHAGAINALNKNMNNISNEVRKVNMRNVSVPTGPQLPRTNVGGPVHATHNMHEHNGSQPNRSNHTRPHVTAAAPPAPPTKTNKVKNEMDEAYGSSSESDDEPEEAPRPPPPKQNKSKMKKKVMFAGGSDRSETNDMDDVKAKAARMQQQAERE